MSAAADREGGLPTFDVEPHRDALLAILREIEALAPEAATEGEPSRDPIHHILRKHPRAGSGFFSRSQILAGYRYWKEREPFALEENEFVARLRLRPVRSESGVTPVTVLTQPFPCPGKCIFCPNDVRMPKSYLSDEPGAQRAAMNRFDPYLQTWNRLAAYRAIGHPTDKIELIVLGGTWSFYPPSYQVWFVQRLFEALNDFGAGRDGRARATDPAWPDLPDWSDLPARVDGREHEANPYNRMVRRFLSDAAHAPGEREAWDRLEAAHAANETSAARCVGLSLETRPDEVTPVEVARLRRLGATKIQIGIQSLSDRILEQNKRGHGVSETREALRRLRAAGFKLHVHWMPNLLGATPESDRAEFRELFDDPAFRPDELKLYPCSLIESAELMQFYERGEWRPYEHDELLEVVCSALADAPRTVRLTRVIRDISSDDIVVGNKRTNFREIATRELEQRGARVRDIRAREIRGDVFDPDSLRLRETPYETSTGREIFLEFETPDERLAAFLRLSLPSPDPTEEVIAELPELRGAAVIREVHVYGAAVSLGARAERSEVQHRGLGRRLIERALEIAAGKGFERVAVISAVGTREYYGRQGFESQGAYQIRPIASEGAQR